MSRLLAFAATVIVSLGAGSSGNADDIFGHSVRGSLDSQIAEQTRRALIAHAVPDNDAVADALAQEGPPGYLELIELTRRTSVDTAALVLIARMSRQAQHAAAQDLYWRYLDRLRRWGREGWPIIVACLGSHDLPEIHFVPGWFYRRNPTTGADFASQRRLLDALGLRWRLIAVEENASVEANAAIIAAHVRGLEPSRRVILVSTSKGGPETAHALGALLSPADTAPVRAWVNVGGVLAGSPLADAARTWPLSWLAWAALALDGVDAGESLPSLTSARADRRRAAERMPGLVMIFNYVGVPLSGDVTDAARDGYDRLRRFGPNDGLTPLVHQWSHGGAVVLEVGLDHFYRDAEIDIKTAAMAFSVFERLGEIRGRECVRP
ncbi:MAG: hypothetical protein SFV19_10215 [Rhodospirillaceae bacterium]|nr:hypothetical protein [Rhodospirillaceae bacterium]